MYMKRMNKKGAELTIGTIVIIVLAIAVLVFLIYGFTTGWTNLWGKITVFSGGGSTISEVSQACAIACAQEDSYAFNILKRTVRNENGFENKTVTCEDLTGTVNLVKGNEDPVSLSPIVDDCNVL